MTIQDAAYCSVNGLIQYGATCAHMIAGDACSLTTKEVIDLIDAQPEDRTCVPACGLPACAEDQSHGTKVLIKARGASIIMLASDWGQKKNEADLLCRESGKKCVIGTPTPFPSPQPSVGVIP